MENKDQNNIDKPAWWKPAIKSNGVGCLCCGGTSEILELDTKLYFGMVGGWNILKNGQEFFCDGRDVEYEEYQDLKHVEQLIGEDTENEYIANFDSPLRSAIYQRHAKNSWVLIERGDGFA
jgi:hypothetical protein